MVHNKYDSISTSTSTTTSPCRRRHTTYSSHSYIDPILFSVIEDKGPKVDTGDATSTDINATNY